MNNQTYLTIDVIPKDNASKYPSQLAEPENVTKMEPIFYVYVRIG
jgi:hypothetical protein